MNPPAIDPKRLLPLLVLTAMVGPSALNMPLPAVPGLAVEFGSDVATVQLVITLFLFGFATSQLILGPLSDRFGRRPVLIAGLTLAVVTGLVAAYASSIGWLLLARALQSLGASSGVVLGRAIIRDLYERDRAASMMGWVTMAMAAAPMVSPAIGGLLTETVGWRWIFIFSSVLAGLALTGAFLWLPETRPQNMSVSARSIAHDGWALVRD
ncbi:MAG: MFS transporter, partial [Alphaproteobacteria bacterium]